MITFPVFFYFYPYINSDNAGKKKTHKHKKNMVRLSGKFEYVEITTGISYFL